MIDQQTYWNQVYAKSRKNIESFVTLTFALETKKYLQPHSKILELGCGTGNDAVYFASQGHNVTASDFSQTIITKNRLNAHAHNLTFIVLDISEPLPFSDNTFDLVYARLSLHYFADATTRAIFKEVHRVLKNNGVLAFICKSIHDPLYGKGRQLETDMFENEGHVRHFFSEEYAKKCLNNIFAVDIFQSGEEVFYNKPSAYVKAIGKAVK